MKRKAMTLINGFGRSMQSLAVSPYERKNREIL